MKNMQSILLFFADENEKLPINELLEVLTGAGTFTRKSSFDIQSLQFVTTNTLKKPMPKVLQLFTFYLVVPSSYFLSEFEAISHNAMFVGRWGKCIYP